MAWTEEQQAELVRLAAEGLTGKEIGERLGFSRNAVLGRARRTGVKLPITQRKTAAMAEQMRQVCAKLTPCDVRCIRESIAAGVSLAEIAETWGVSKTTISRIKFGRTWRHLLPPPAQTTPEQKGRG